MNNKTNLHNSIRFLSQPYTIFALFLYACNEFVLQRYFPSWLSGKLSDFAWFFIAPVILTLLLSFVLPLKPPPNKNTIPFLAYGLTALFFIGIKTIPIFNDFILQCWLAVFHYPAAIAMDTTDLLALMVLPLSWILWWEKEIKWKSSIYQTAIMFFVFAIITLADAPGPNYGIVSIGAYDGKLIADASHTDYYSENGGLDWHECHSCDEKLYASLQYHELPYNIQIPDSNIHYLITTNGRIQISKDNGTSWHKLENQDYQSDVSVYYQQLMNPNAYITNPGAKDMVYDPVSGNIVVAMGLVGAVVIQPDGKAVQVGIGENRPADLRDLSIVFSILSPFLLLSLVLIMIYFSTLVLFPIKADHRFRLISALLLWGIFAPSFKELFSGYGAIISIAFIFIFAIIIISLMKRAWRETRKQIQDNRELFCKYIISSIPGGLAFFLCYVLWYLKIIPYLNWAIIISYCIGLIGFIYCIIQSNKLR